MKKFILFVPFLLFVFKGAHGQTNIYHPFPDSNAVWNMNYYQYCFGPTSQENYSIVMSGDTVINTQTYHKLNIPHVQVLSQVCGLNTTNGYKGAIRQDIVLKKVFFVPPSSNTEELFYDFNLQVGDTVTGYFGTTFSTMPEIVESIDSVLVGSNYHKRWILNSLYQVHLIEGVGSTYGLFVPMPGGNISEQPQRSINCFSQNGGTSLYPPASVDCDAILSIDSKENEVYQIKMFPNPASDFINIEMQYESSDRYVQIIDVHGRVLVQVAATGFNATVDVSGLQAGFYLLKIVDGSLEIVKNIYIN